MQKVITYSFSKSINKSLSYTSGIDGDLSFDITYYFKHSVLNASYYTWSLFVSKIASTSINNHTLVSKSENMAHDMYKTYENIYRYSFNDLIFDDLSIGIKTTDSKDGSLSDYILGISTLKNIDKNSSFIFSKINHTDDTCIYDHHMYAGFRNKQVGSTSNMRVWSSSSENISLQDESDNVKKDEYGAIISKMIVLWNRDNVPSNVNECIYVDYDKLKVDMIDNIHVSTTSKELFVDTSLAGDIISDEIHIFSDCAPIDNKDTELTYQNELYAVGTLENNLNYVSNNVLLANESDELALYELTENIGQNTSSVNEDQYTSFYSKYSHSSNMNDSLFVSSPTNLLNYDASFAMVDFPTKGTLVFSQKYAEKLKTGVLVDESGGNLNNSYARGIYDTPIIHTKQDNIGVDIDYSYSSLCKRPLNTHADDINYTIDKRYIASNIQESITTLGNISRPISEKDSNVFFRPLKYKLYIHDSFYNYVEKCPYGIRSAEELSIGRLENHGIFSSDKVDLSKNGLPIYVDSNVNVYKNILRHTSVYDIATSFSKYTKPIFFKETYSYNSKCDVPIFISNLKYSYWISKYNHPVFESDNKTGIDKSYKPIFTQWNGYWFEAVPKPIFSYNGINDISSTSRKIVLSSNDECITKKYSNIDLNDFCINFIPKYRITKLTYDTSYISRVSYPIDDIDYMTVNNTYRNGGIEDTLLNFKKEGNMSRNEHELVSKYDVRNSNIQPICTAEVDDSSGIFTSDTVEIDTPTYLTAIEESGDNFAYTEKISYALIKDDRTDEMQLPSSDFNYSTFAKSLLSDDGQVILKYIKKYDEQTGNPIVSLPIENPIKYFSDMAIHYVDLNVGMLTYIIEKAYNIWQHNIFTYSAMPSNAALNDILIKLNDGLFIQYPSESDQYQLKRAIRLFRWYAEMSILNNSDYMLKLNYKDLSVDYINKEFSLFEEVATVVNMHIDDSYVLTPIAQNEPSEIYISFERSHETRLVFDVAVSGGSCEILINGAVNSYTNEFVKVDERLKIGRNDVIVRFVPGSNPMFNIMKLSIKQYAITSYVVSYIGKIGETNPTVNHLISMLSVCNDSIEDIQRTVANATPTAQTLNQLRVYFELHHADKIKGKRLTIKH